MDEKICNIPDCKNQDFSFWLYNGRQYCQCHYNSIFLAELTTHYESWDGKTEPPDRLKYLVGRLYSEREIAYINQPSLTKAIVHERSYGWEKTDDGVIFTAVRYPVNRKYCGPFGETYFDELHQTWEFNVRTLRFTFLSEERK